MIIKWLFGFLLCLPLLHTSHALDSASPLLFLGNERLPPLTWVGDGEVVGLAVDLTQAAVDQAGLSVRIDGRNWPTAQNDVLTGKADAVLHISPNTEREKLFDFTDPLIESRFTVFRQSTRPDIQGESSLQGKTVGVENGGFPMAYLRKNDRIRLVHISDWKTGFSELAEGKLDAIVVDRWVGEWVLQRYDIAGVTVVDPALLTTTSRIAVKKGNRVLVEQINEGLSAIARNGTRQKILDKWSAKQVVYVAQETVTTLTYLAAGAAIGLMLLSLAYAFKIRKINLLLTEHDARLKHEINERQHAESTLKDVLATLEQRITERTAELEQVTHELRESEARFRLALRNSPVTVAVQDRTLRYIWAYNQRTARPEEIIGHTDAEIFTAAEAARLDTIKRRVLDEGIELDEQMWLERPSGRIFLHVYWEPIYDEAGQVIGVGATTVDLTALKLTEDALREAKEAAEAASQARSTFLANMSHEIRTPLNAILGLARMAQREDRGRSSESLCSRIVSSGNHLLGVINDILDFSRIDAGKLAVEVVPMPLPVVIEEAFALVGGSAAAKGLTLTYQPGADLPQWVSGDPMRLRQILVNLLSNAIKFTPQGSITLSVARDGQDTRFSLRDEGIGITQQQLKLIFEPFEQADKTTTRRFGGTGLGLTISRTLARLMGGDLTAVSTPGKGSTFTLTLPLPVCSALAQPEEATETDTPITGIHVLAAEDEPINRLVLEDMLSEAGVTCIFVENGLEAVDLVRATPAAFDAVLMDVEMPVMDGREATRQIHAISPFLPVIGLTAHALADERRKCLDAGMVDYVTKPIEPETLYASLGHWAGWGALHR